MVEPMFCNVVNGYPILLQAQSATNIGNDLV